MERRLSTHQQYTALNTRQTLISRDTGNTGSGPVTLCAVPKPERAPRLQTKEALRRKRQLANARRTANKSRNEHGGKDWGVQNDAARRRDGNRCVFRCPTQRLGVQVHHWQRSVGAGGKNQLANLVTVCASCHDAIHVGRISREQIRERLLALYGPTAVTLDESVPPSRGGLWTENELDSFGRDSIVDGRR